LLAAAGPAQDDTDLAIVPDVGLSEPGEPPEGFGWEKLEEINARFLRPEGWFLKIDTAGEGISYFITRENYAAEGQFQVGLSMSVRKRPNDSTAMPVFELCRNMIGDRISKHEVVTSWEAISGPTLKGNGCLARVPTAAGGRSVVIYLAMGSSKTNTLYLLSFEAPEQLWAGYQELGRTMMTQFVLDDEY
jgi:hypothetical protein